MKALVALVVIGGIVCLGGWWIMSEATKDPGVPIAIAFGNPKGQEIELHVVVAMGMTSTERPSTNLRTGAVEWGEWVDEHFDLHAESGDKVPLKFRNGSELIPAHKAGGVPEGYLFGKVRPDTKYTFDYIPKAAESKRYRYVFAAPAEPLSIQRVTFKPPRK